MTTTSRSRSWCSRVGGSIGYRDNRADEAVAAVLEAEQEEAEEEEASVVDDMTVEAPAARGLALGRAEVAAQPLASAMLPDSRLEGDHDGR